jgi:acetolactate synthase-1/2/3 large subunit
VGANRPHRILQAELARAVVAEPGSKPWSLIDLTRPTINWTGLVRGFGMSPYCVHTNGELADAFIRAFAEHGPSLIEAVLP